MTKDFKDWDDADMEAYLTAGRDAGVLDGPSSDKKRIAELEEQYNTLIDDAVEMRKQFLEIRHVAGLPDTAEFCDIVQFVKDLSQEVSELAKLRDSQTDIVQRQTRRITELETKLESAVQFLVVGDLDGIGHNPIFIQKVVSNGELRWKVTRLGNILTKWLTWEYEPLPSSRTEDFLERCRYETYDEALTMVNKYLELSRK